MKSIHISCVVLFVAIVPFSLRTFAQQGERLRDTTPATSNSAGDYVEGTDSSERTKAVDEADSRAEKEAERLVSIPPEKIVLMLQQEPGLFLEVKKLLVRRAYSQGQVLDPKDLTDNAVFRLVRDDEEVRALITEQILDRGYIRAKPTREELLKEVEEQRRMQENAAAQSYSYPYSQGDADRRATVGLGSNQPNAPQNGAQYGPSG